MVELAFYGSKKSGTNEIILRCYCTIGNEIFLGVKEKNFVEHFICIDKQTAIKFSRELRKQIARIEDEESI